MEQLIEIDGMPIRVHGRALRLARPEADTYRAIGNLESVIERVRSYKPRLDLFTFMQPLAMAFAMVLSLGALPCLIDWDDWAVLPVSTFDHWWTAQADENVRNKVRKAEKNGVGIRQVSLDANLTRGIWEIYNELPVRQGRPYPHFGKDMEAVRSEMATFSDCSIFLGAFLRDELIGFMKLTYDETRSQLKTMSLAAMARHRDKAVMNALIARAVRMSAEQGIPNLIYGSFSYGKTSMDGLSEFKRNNGFLRVDLPRYYVPLTPFGRAGLRLGLHHPLTHHLPEPIFAGLRNLRKAYYNHKLRVWRENSEALSRSFEEAANQRFPGLPAKLGSTFPR